MKNKHLGLLTLFISFYSVSSLAAPSYVSESLAPSFQLNSPIPQIQQQVVPQVQSFSQSPVVQSIPVQPQPQIIQQVPQLQVQAVVPMAPAPQFYTAPMAPSLQMLPANQNVFSSKVKESSRSEEIKKLRLEAEQKTQEAIIEKLETDRIEAEKKRNEDYLNRLSRLDDKKDIPSFVQKDTPRLLKATPSKSYSVVQSEKEVKILGGEESSESTYNFSSIHKVKTLKSEAERNRFFFSLLAHHPNHFDVKNVRK